MIRNNSHILRCENVHKSFKQCNTITNVLNGITVAFEKNRTYALTGVSGSGKSTLLYILAGFEEPSSGELYFDDRNINTLNKIEKRDFLFNSLGFIFQLPYLLSELSVIENVMLKGLIGGISYSVAERVALDLLDQVGLLAKATNNPNNLSGGEQQRVAIARALFNQPAFLIADEPTAHLDEKTRTNIIKVLLECQRQWSMGLIIACHDPAVAEQMDIVLELHDGVLK